MSDPADAVPEVLRGMVELFPGGTPLTATTTSPAFDVSTPNRILVNAIADQPARAWINVTGAGSVQLQNAGGARTWASTPSAVEAAATAMNATPFTARVLFSAGRSEPLVHFLHDQSDQFDPDASESQALTPLIEFLKRHPSINVRVVGYTDLSGAGPYNLTLSQARANFIRQHLLDHGVPAGQITEAIGRGENTPVVNTPGRERLNRRVQLELVGDLANVVLVETIARGDEATWDSGRPTVAAGGSLISAINGTDGVAIADGATIGLSGHDFVASAAAGSTGTTHRWVAGATADGAARALAAAIEANTDIDAYAEGRVVKLLPVGSHALIHLESRDRNAGANNLTLTATGSLSRTTAFAGASEGGEPANGNTVTIGSTVLTCTTEASPGTRQFAKGTDANSTATNLATAVSAISGMTGTAAAAVVTVRGLSGTRISTNNTGAFVISAATISGERPVPERSERNTTVAVGLSMDVGYSRRFGLETTGNSRIAARLVSLPAPVELLDEIRTFLGPNPGQAQPS